MSAFTGNLTVTCLDEDALMWRLEEPLSYEVGRLGSGIVITVPQSFETDVATIPRPIRWILPAWGRYSRAAIVHDYIYYQLTQEQPVLPVPASRKDADGIFHEAMIVSKVPRPLAWIMWAAVRVGGSVHARQKRRRRQKVET